MKTPAGIYCEHCGAVIEADSKFCAQCGNKLSENSPRGQVQSEPPVGMGEDPTSKPLVVAGICIIAVLVGTLLFSVVYKSSSAPTERDARRAVGNVSYPPEMPLEQLKTTDSGMDDWGECGLGIFMKVVVLGNERWMAWFTRGAHYPYKVTRNFYPDITWAEAWVDPDADGKPAYYFTDHYLYNQKFGSDCEILGRPLPEDRYRRQ